MRVNLADGKHVFVDSKVPLSAFLDAAGTEDEQQKAAPPRPVRAARPHPRRPALEQAVLEGRRVARVRGAVPAERGVLLRRAGPDARPLRVRRQEGRRHGHPDHADRHAARHLLRLEAGRARRQGRRGVPARPRAPRAAGPDGRRSTSSAARSHSSVNAYNETVGTVEARVLVSARRFRDLQVSERELAPLQRRRRGPQIQAPELSTTRPGRAAGRRARPVPSVETELWRPTPTALWSRRRRCGPRRTPVRGLVWSVRGLRRRRRLRPVHGPVLRARSPRCSPTGPGCRATARVLDVGLRARRAHRGAGPSLRRRASLAVDPSPAVRRRCPRARCPASTSSRAPPSSCPTPTTRSTPRSPSSSSTSWPTRSRGLSEMARVTRPGGVVAACVWDHAGGRGPLSLFWSAVRSLATRSTTSRGAPGSARGTSQSCSARPGCSDVRGDRST